MAEGAPGAERDPVAYCGGMEDHLSTEQLGWVLGRSSGSIRRAIGEGEIEATRIPDGFRIAKDEVLRLSRETVEQKAGRKLSDGELEQLIDEVISTNEARIDEQAGGEMKPIKPRRKRRSG